jgi:hypothetical protein
LSPPGFHRPEERNRDDSLVRSVPKSTNYRWVTIEELRGNQVLKGHLDERGKVPLLGSDHAAHLLERTGEMLFPPSGASLFN